MKKGSSRSSVADGSRGKMSSLFQQVMVVAVVVATVATSSSSSQQQQQQQRQQQVSGLTFCHAFSFSRISSKTSRSATATNHHHHHHQRSQSSSSSSLELFRRASSASSSSSSSSSGLFFSSPTTTGRRTEKSNISSSQKIQTQLSQSSDINSEDDIDIDDDGDDGPTLWEKITASLSQKAATKLAKKYNRDIAPITHRMSTLTLVRTLVPSVLAGVVAFVTFPQLALWLCTLFSDAGVFTVLSQDSSQFVQNFLTVAGLLFSILVGQTYYFMYQQQEMVYYALFNEVTEAKSLLEQVALVSQGRSMYPRVLNAISTYVETDLKKLQSDPAVLLSARPMDDPLETIMYLTSVGVPSTVYETVRSLRQARAQRLGALQRKLPQVHMTLLWILAIIELISFPLLGAGTQTLGGYKILTIEGCLFGVMTAGIVLTLRVVGELWRPAGGAYNVDSVLKVMVRGLEQELAARLAGKTIKAQRDNFPSSQSENTLPPQPQSSTTPTTPRIVKVD